ncbi:MAG: hypothetical protein ACNA8P_04415 [Phycisphaerales bacterium]
MRLVIITIVCSALTIGGFFGYKQYERNQTKDEALQFLTRSVQVASSEGFGDEARNQVNEYIAEHLSGTFAAHYSSGGLFNLAEFNEVAFMRDIFERVRDDIRTAAVPESTKQLAQRLYLHSRPLD